MNGIKQGSGRRPRLAAALRSMAGIFVNLVRELNYAQRRSTDLFLGRDGYLVGPAGPARTYREFLDRTSGRLVHEPSASARLTGQPVR